MALKKLVLTNLTSRKARAALTIAAVALSVSLVVSVTSGYASVEAAVYRYLEQYMGSVDAEIVRANDPAIGTSESLLKELRADPEVLRADGRYETASTLTDLEGNPMSGRVAVIGVRRPEDRRSDYLKVLAGGWFDTPTGNAAVVDQATAEALKLEVGGEFILPGDEGQKLRMKIVGIVHKPAILAQYMRTMYVPLDTLQDFAGKDGVVSRVWVDLHRGADPDAWAKRWEPRVEKADPNLKMRLARDSRREMDKQLEGIHLLSYLGGTVSMLAATFIVFSALSMGVAERQRTLAMLRAVGAFRSQVGWLVVWEGVILAAVGALIGVPLGVLWVTLLKTWFSDFFIAGVVVSWGGVIFGTLGSVAAALLASFLPAWSAMRVDPLEAMSPLASPPAAGPPLWATLLGLLLVAIDPFIFFGPVDRIVAATGASDVQEASRWVKFYAHFALGLPGVMVGFFLLSPLFVWVIERVLGPVVAPAFGLRYAMLRQQLSGGVWRAAGTCAALMVGLAVLVVMQTNGNTVLSGWRLPDKFPDIFIMTGVSKGLTFEQQQRIESIPGIRKGEVMPIGIASPEYGSNMVGIAMAAIMPNATMFIGIDPDKAFDLMELDFREGNAADARVMLKKGGHLIVTEEFRQLKGLGLGDKLQLKTTKGDREFTIAGVVWSPGIDVMVSMFDMSRQFDQRTAASVFGTLEDGRRYFGIQQVYLFAANLEMGHQKEALIEDLQRELGAQGMRAGDVREIKYNIQQGFRKILLLISTVAFAAMAVSALGVTNTIMASVRSRQWQFGVLRSIGVTRGQLLRLVLAEAFLLGLVGVGLGLVAGFEMTVNANALGAIVTGYAPPIAVPWGMIFGGVAIVLSISMLASIWPATAAARTDPLTLLQAGRASA
ncbi:MAG TPA: FtsX-like permease family protein [Tepidisphaeraceae bacterium]|nr:FtsX-like permease family protein [Tepidisphaeraceae bacterium]